MYATFLEWLKNNQIGDLTGLLGILISLIGFAVTLYGVTQSRKAAEQAAAAAQSARDGIKLFDTVVDFSAAIATLEEIKRAHRQSAWDTLPDRYSSIRKTLITLRVSTPDLLSENQQAFIQTAVVNLIDIEAAVERGLVNPAALKPARFNALISEDVDNLVRVLTELKTKSTGGTIDG